MAKCWQLKERTPEKWDGLNAPRSILDSAADGSFHANFVERSPNKYATEWKKEIEGPSQCNQTLLWRSDL